MADRRHLRRCCALRVGEVAGVFSLLTGSLSLSTPFLGANGVGLWRYWTALEGYRGQSAGKVVMDIAVTDRRGDDIGYAAAAVEIIGKAFLLPLDVLIGWLAMEGEYVRLIKNSPRPSLSNFPRAETCRKTSSTSHQRTDSGIRTPCAHFVQLD